MFRAGQKSGGSLLHVAFIDQARRPRAGVDQRQTRARRHAAEVRYFDFTPVLIGALAAVIGARYLAIGAGDTARSIVAGMRAAVVLSIRRFRFRGAGKAN